jgi:putative endonuclease
MLFSILSFADRARDRGRRRAWDAAKALGRRGEDVAHRHLQREGLTVVARNYRTATGSAEIDLVAWEGDTLVFAEVKTRTTTEFGPPDRAVGDEKRRAMVKAAQDYARRAEVPWEKVRFDVVNVVCSTPPAVTHFRDAFSAGYLFTSPPIAR